MGNKKTVAPEVQATPELANPYVGGEDDDLMDMEYIQNPDTASVDTHPPQTKEEADELAEAAKLQEEADAAAKVAEEEAEKELIPDGDKDDSVAEEEAEAPAEEETVLEDDEPRIPKDRFDAVNNQRKKVEEENAALKLQLESLVEKNNEEPEPEPYDYKAKEKEAMDALLEGDAEKYSAINEEIRTAEKDEYLREAKKIAAQGDQSLQENMTFEEAGAKIEADFPQLSQSSDTFDKAARTEMLDLYVGYARSGSYTRVQALQRAAATTARIYGFNEVPEVEDETPDNVVSIKPVDTKKKVKAAQEQPPNMEGGTKGGNEEPKFDIKSMSDEEFDGLPESTKKRMRGDIVS